MRWVGVVVILAIASVVALWPREDSGQSVINSPTPAQDDAALADGRGRAALDPCPAAAPGTSAPSGPLADVAVRCLGAPGTVDLGDALAGRTVLLNLWASWCQPCREEMPVLQAYAAEPGALPVLGVNVKDQASDALDTVITLGVRYPSVFDDSEAVQRALKVPQILPVSYLVRPDGSVAQVTEPLVFRTPEEVRTAVERFGPGSG